MKLTALALTATLASTVSAYPWMASEFHEGRGLSERSLFDTNAITQLVNLAKNADPTKLAALTTQVQEGVNQVQKKMSASGVSIPDAKLMDTNWGDITKDSIYQAYGLDRTNNNTKRGLALWGPAEDADHPWQAPGPGDLRGPCPGLNTAANHGYIPRNGVINPVELFVGTWEALSLSPDVAAILATLSFLFRGDLTTLTLSIGTQNGLGGGLAEHGVLEGDASVTRDDRYFGDDWSPVPAKVDLFKQEVVQYGGGNVDPISLSHARKRAFDDSKANNPSFDFNPWRMIVAYGESGFVMEALRGDSIYFTPDMIDSWFIQERFPPGWSRRAIPITVPELLCWIALIEGLNPTIPGWSILGVYSGDITTWANLAGWFSTQPGGTGKSTIGGVGCSVANIFLGWFPDTIAGIFGKIGLPAINGGLHC